MLAGGSRSMVGVAVPFSLATPASSSSRRISIDWTVVAPGGWISRALWQGHYAGYCSINGGASVVNGLLLFMDRSSFNRDQSCTAFVVSRQVLQLWQSSQHQAQPVMRRVLAQIERRADLAKTDRTTDQLCLLGDSVFVT